MVEACRFDFTKFEYTFDANYTLGEQQKDLGKRGKTASTLQRLFECSTAEYSKDLLKNLQLELFTSQLRVHLEDSIKRRYWFFGYLIIFVSYTFSWGPLARLRKLEGHFTELLEKNSQTQRESIQNASQLVGLTLALDQIDPLLQDRPWYREAKKSIQEKFEQSLPVLSQKDLATILRYLFREEFSNDWYINFLKRGPQAKELPTLLLALQESKADQELKLTETVRDVLQATGILELEQALRRVDPVLHQGGWYIEALKRLETLFVEKMPSESLHEHFVRLASFLLTKNPSSDILQSLALKEPLLAKVNERYKQIPATSMGISERLRLAYFIETRLSSLNIKHIKKNSHDIPFTLHIDSDTQDVYVAFKRKVPLLDKHGVMKKVTCALHLPKSTTETGNLVAHLTSLDSCTAFMLSIVIKEHDIAKDMAAQDGVWPVLYAAQHEKVTKAGARIKKFSQFAKLATGDLSQLGPKLSLTDQIKAASTLLNALQAFHKKKLIYGDMKGANVLVEIVAEKLSKIGLIDFGHTIQWNKKGAAGSMAEGVYGTTSYTPPEVFGVNGYMSDYEKADVWALGLTLYRYCLKREPSWANILKNKKAEVSLEEKEAFKKMVNEEIEEPLAKLSKKENPTLEDKFLLLVYKMMRLKPFQRLNIDEALNEVAKLNE